ncbi:MAG: universal stress protein [Proteobacteria bacterium]|nr:MAG: universal stress protein [Pseudomonadota bacterium]
MNTARFLAKKLHAPLHLVHAVRPAFSYVGSGDVTINPYYGYETSWSEKEERDSKAKIARLLESIDDVEVHSAILRDFPADALLTYAHEQKAGLILSGVSMEDKSRNRVLSGLSTGLSLASDSDIPVLLVPKTQKLRLEQGLRIMVADNFEREGELALTAGMSLANALHAEQLTHVHVQDTSFSDIDKMIESVRESVLLGNMEADPLLNREYYMEQVRAKGREELIRRCHQTKVKALNSTIYEAVTAFGNPVNEVHAEVLRTGSQLMVFGRHHMIRRKTLSLGRIPYSAMIEDGVATLIVPDEGLAGNSFFNVGASH